MSIWNFLGLHENWPFSTAIALMLMFALVEGVGLLLGAGLSGLLDSLLPDMDMDLDIAAPEYSNPSLTVRFLGWLHIGRVPALIVLILFLTTFGMLGLALQSFSSSLTGRLLPAALACLVALPLSLPIVRVFTGIIAKIMPQDESEAVSASSFVGKLATLTLGEARRGSPAQAKLTDIHGQTHYVMVEPDTDNETFKTGDHVLITEHAGSFYRAIRSTHTAFMDEL